MDLYNEDFVLAARRVGRHQLTRLETSPYQRELLARGLDRRARGECPNRRMEQGMGYSAAIGMVLMDELAGVCVSGRGHLLTLTAAALRYSLTP